jgi:DNA-binding CsgD family transcriptional regulator
VRPGPSLDNLTDAIGRACRSGLAPEVLRDRVLGRLRRVVPFDAAAWLTVDPATLLLTGAHQQEIPPDTIPYFVANEWGGDDVNKWTSLAADQTGVRTLLQATDGKLAASAHYRDVFAPLGLGDELRAVLRTGDTCWGCLCLHRERGHPFTPAEARYVQRIAPHVADGIRAGLLVASVDLAPVVDTPGLVVLTAEGSLRSMTVAGAQWLDELGQPGHEQHGLPPSVRTLAAQLLRAGPDAGVPRLRTRTRAGRWAVLHASRLPGSEADDIAVIIEEPTPAELAPVLMAAHGLTAREREVTALVCRGLSTRAISNGLSITVNTVQEHLKSIFGKTGVRSRRELVSAILRDQYIPRVAARRPIGPAGSFVD